METLEHENLEIPGLTVLPEPTFASDEEEYFSFGL
jgi:hypothetical protein